MNSYFQKGVGDTPHSYAYDGHRIRKWNITTYKYGEVSITFFFSFVKLNLTIFWHFFNSKNISKSIFKGLDCESDIVIFFFLFHSLLI